MTNSPAPAMRTLAGLHAGYLVATGVWPLVHRKSFEALTGRKKDFWLVRTVGGLAAACGLTLAMAVLRGRRTPEVQVLAGAQAIVFGLADLHAATSQSRIYLADIGVQAVCMTGWLRPWDSERLS